MGGAGGHGVASVVLGRAGKTTSSSHGSSGRFVQDCVRTRPREPLAIERLLYSHELRIGKARKSTNKPRNQNLVQESPRSTHSHNLAFPCPSITTGSCKAVTHSSKILVPFLGKAGDHLFRCLPRDVHA